jgi:predicted ATPase
MGKSRLLAEFSDRVRQAGGKAAAARCYTAEGSLAFAPLAAWLRARPLPPLEAPWLAEIARLLPEVHAQKAGPPPALAPLEDWQRPRLFEATARALLYSSQPLLLTLDDLQWCDRDTLDWLRFLLQYDGKTEVLVAASLRPEELHGRRPLQSFLSSLRQSANFHLVDLAPLDPEQTARLAGQAAGGIVAPETGSRLYQASLGNPYFVIEMAACGWAQIKAANGSSPEIPPLPPAVEALLCARLERISPAAGSVLELAAAAGLRCPYPLLVEQSGLGERRLVNVLDELTGRLILAEEQTDTSYETGNAGPTLAYHFTHPLLRQVAWSRLSAARRRLLANAVQGARNKARVTS